MAERDPAHHAEDEQSEVDPWTIALFVYFVALIVVVAGLLVLPALY